MPFLSALGVVIYVVLVALLMMNGDAIFGTAQTVVAPIAVLLLFVLSAAVVGALILGKPLMMYLDGEKKDAVKMFIRTVLWLVVFTLTALLALMII